MKLTTIRIIRTLISVSALLALLIVNVSAAHDMATDGLEAPDPVGYADDFLMRSRTPAVEDSDAPTSYIDSILFTSDNRASSITCAEREAAEEIGLEILNKITDPAVLEKLVDEGVAKRSDNGELPDYIMVYRNISGIIEQPNPSRFISITKTDYYDGQYVDENDRYVIQGPCNFEQTYSRKSEASWNTSMISGVTVGGTLYGVAEVKAAVSSSMGYTIGKSYEKTSKYTVNIPSGKIWEIKIWTSYKVFTYTAKVGSVTLATGKSWYPNGLIILHTQYNA